MARQHTEVLPRRLRGEGFAQPNPTPMFANPPGLLRAEPHSPGLRRPYLVGRRLVPPRSGPPAGPEPQVLDPDDRGAGEPFHSPGASRSRPIREAWKAAGHEREPRVSVSRSIFAIVDDRDRTFFGRRNERSRPGRLSSTRRRGRCSAAPMPPSPTSWSRARRGRGDQGGRHADARRSPTSSASTTTPTRSRASSVRRAGARLALSGRSQTARPRRWPGTAGTGS